MQQTVMVKGDRLATVSRDNVSIIDVASETFTDIDLDKKTYATITFADWQRAMDELARKMEQDKKKQDASAEMNFKISVDKTGKTKTVSGIAASEAILKLVMEMKDKESGNSGNMLFTSNMFLAPKVGGYDEITRFYQRMGQKLNWSPMGRMAAMMGAGSSGTKGFADLYKEASKLDGLPVYQIVRMGAGPAVENPSSEPSPEGPSAGQMAGSAASDAASDAATGAASNAANSRMGRLGGLTGGLGGFGGFGRKKKQQQEQPAAAEQPDKQAGGLLFEMTTEITSFSAAPIDAAKFEVPAGFKKVQHEFEKQLK